MIRTTGAIKCDPRHAKSYFRRAQAQIELKAFKEALNDLNQFILLDPSQTKSAEVQNLFQIAQSGFASEALPEVTPPTNELPKVEVVKPKVEPVKPKVEQKVEKKIVFEPTKVPLALPTEKPTSFFSFVHHWESLKKDEVMLAQYFSMFQPEELPGILQQSLSQDIFVSFLRVIHNDTLPKQYDLHVSSATSHNQRIHTRCSHVGGFKQSPSHLTNPHVPQRR